MQVPLLLANIILGVFYQYRNPFNFVSNICCFACGRNHERNLTARLFKMKLNHEINWSCSKKKFNFKIQLTLGSRSGQLVGWLYVIFFEGYLHLRQLVIRNYDQKLSQNIYRRLLAAYLVYSLKGTLMQIWKSANNFAFTWRLWCWRFCLQTLKNNRIC